VIRGGLYRARAKRQRPNSMTTPALGAVGILARIYCRPERRAGLPRVQARLDADVNLAARRGVCGASGGRGRLGAADFAALRAAPRRGRTRSTGRCVRGGSRSRRRPRRARRSLAARAEVQAGRARRRSAPEQEALEAALPPRCPGAAAPAGPSSDGLANMSAYLTISRRRQPESRPPRPARRRAIA
jgi:hypothetical protein